MKENIINTRINEGLKSELDFISLEEGKSISTIVREALSAYVENHGLEDLNINVCDLDADDFETKDGDFISPQSFIDLFIWFRSYNKDCERDYSDYEIQEFYNNAKLFIKNSESRIDKKNHFLIDIDDLSSRLHRFIEILSIAIKDESIRNYNNEEFDVDGFREFLGKLTHSVATIYTVYLNVPNYDS
jgi:predicted DNA-binding protein